jgi:hypothetical protein
MWEHVLDAMERRYWRREGVELEDIELVKRLLAEAVQKEKIQNSSE